MASIKLSELRPVGSDLFQDNESFLEELGDRDMNSVVGGFFDYQYNSQFTQNINNQQYSANAAVSFVNV
jgi:hypothetical protein